MRVPVTRTGSVFPIAYLIVLVLPCTGSSPSHSWRRHRHSSLPKLLNTPVQRLDDSDIWRVAGYLSNTSHLPEMDDANRLDNFYYAEMLDYILGSEVDSTDAPPAPDTLAVVSMRQPLQRPELVAGLAIEGSPRNFAAVSSGPRAESSQSGRRRPEETGQRGAFSGPAVVRRDGRARTGRVPLTARDRFYFLHHLRPDLPALDEVLSEETAEPEPEPPATTEPPPPPSDEALTSARRLQKLLRDMVTYGEGVHGDEGSPEVVRKLEVMQGGRPTPPSRGKKLARLIEDKSILKSRRRRSAGLKPDMKPLTDHMMQESYSQELINSFQTGNAKRHNSIKKELREPIDVDLHGVALMAASLRKRSAPARPDEPPADADAAAAEIDSFGAELERRPARAPVDRDSAIYTSAPMSRAATYRARRRRSAAGTRRVLDEIRIAPQLPDLMQLDPEDVLESEESPLLPVLVTSGGGADPFSVTERAALVLEDSGRRPTWTAWGRWGPCSATCGPGQKARYRHCVMGPRCQPGERESDFKPCFRKSCSLPVPGGLVDSF